MSCDLRRRPGQPYGIMAVRVPPTALSHVRPGLRLAGPAWPVIGLQGRRAARAAVRESVTPAGLAERARVARAFTGGVLGPGHPCRDAAVLLVSELFGNSVRHSGSGLAGLKL